MNSSLIPAYNQSKIPTGLEKLEKNLFSVNKVDQEILSNDVDCKREGMLFPNSTVVKTWYET